MQKRTFGKSGLAVSSIGFGAMGLSCGYDTNKTASEALNTVF